MLAGLPGGRKIPEVKCFGKHYTKALQETKEVLWSKMFGSTFMLCKPDHVTPLSAAGDGKAFAVASTDPRTSSLSPPSPSAGTQACSGNTTSWADSSLESLL